MIVYTSIHQNIIDYNGFYSYFYNAVKAAKRLLNYCQTLLDFALKVQP